MKNNIGNLYKSVITYGVGSYNFENAILNPTSGYFTPLKKPATIKQIEMPTNEFAFRNELAQYFREHSDDIFNFSDENYVVATKTEYEFGYLLTLNIYERIADFNPAVDVAIDRNSFLVINIATGLTVTVPFPNLHKIKE